LPIRTASTQASVILAAQKMAAVLWGAVIGRETAMVIVNAEADSRAKMTRHATRAAVEAMMDVTTMAIPPPCAPCFTL